MRTFLSTIAIVVLLAARVAFAQTPEARPTHTELIKRGFRASPEGMQWWRDAKFGVFVHWGVGIEKRHIPWANRTDEVYWDTLYGNLKKVKHFDADKWVQTIQASGAKYVVFMTRQNGAMQRRPGGNLTLWDSQFTDNKLTRKGCPFKRDVCKEFATACHKAKLDLQWYYCGKLDGGLWELLENYGPVRGVWFDGVGVPKTTTAEAVLKKMRTLHPDIVTNAYLGGNKYGGDYGTPQHWYAKGGWSYGPLEIAAILRQGYWYWDTDRGRSRPVKSLKTVINLLVGCVGRGDNLVLNMAPKPDGSFEANEVQRMKELGQWLGKYGRSIFKTRPGPYLPAAWGVSTRAKGDGKTIFLHVLKAIDGGQLTLPPLSARITAIKLLNDPTTVVRVGQTDAKLQLTFPDDKVDHLDTIIELTLDRPAKDATVRYPTPSIKVAKANATQTWTWPAVGCTMERNGPHSAVDGNYASGWCSNGKAARTLTIELDKPQPVTDVIVSHTETIGPGRKDFQGFKVEAFVNNEWKLAFDSRTLKGPDRLRWRHRIPVAKRLTWGRCHEMVTFIPVIAAKWRLTVWGGHAFIREFQLFANRPPW